MIYRSKNLLKILFNIDSELTTILTSGNSLDSIRRELFRYFNRRKEYYNSAKSSIHSLDLAVAEECIEVMRNILSERNEKMVGFSTLEHLLKIIEGKEKVENNRGFLHEFISIFKAVVGKANIYGKGFAGSRFRSLGGREASIARSAELDEMAKVVIDEVSRYSSGLEADIIASREKLKKKILNYFNATESDWKDFRFHLRNIIKDFSILSRLVKLSKEEQEAVKITQEYGIPFGITPYYLSLFNEDGRTVFDTPIRAQVIPNPVEARLLGEGRRKNVRCLDFMLESETSPEELITRRYPHIAIFKPVNTCPQICSYCQRNWEVAAPMFKGAFATRTKIDRALRWFKSHSYVVEVLITGGDPLLLSDKRMEYILNYFCRLSHIERIRIGTRFPVTLPFRITDELMDMVGRFHVPGRREVSFVTHFEHPSEITPDAIEGISKIRGRSMSVYNQTVFTFYNSRRFENVALRKLLRLAGVDPYYTFNAKGKEETSCYRVPVARLMQEVKEEARLVPGLVRTDEPVFNVPALGKNYLKAAQHHRVIGIHPDGGRIIEFHPWEKKLKKVDTYIYKDVPIYDYLVRLRGIGEDEKKYKTIWYYF